MNADMKSVISRDGTTIQYHTRGEGPGLVLLSGANATSQLYLQLAADLADRYTIHVVDRRGRNGSGPQGKDYSLDKEIEDASAVLDQTGSRFLFGHSYGGFITLNLACRYPLEKIAVYDAPHIFPTAWMAEFEAYLGRQDDIGAQVCMIKGLQLNADIMSMPDADARALLELRYTGNAAALMGRLLRTMPKELREIEKQAAHVDQYAKIQAETLLLAGGQSPECLLEAVCTFESIIPACRTRIWPELDHSSPIQRPDHIAQALKEFFV